MNLPISSGATSRDAESNSAGLLSSANKSGSTAALRLSCQAAIRASSIVDAQDT
jgi:hypothetical protein